jgi:hypothetical protein
MSSTVISLAVVSVGFAGWMWYLGQRAARGALRTGPGIRVPATKVCEHTWAAAQDAAAPRYTKLALMLLAVAAATVVLDLVGVESTTVVIAWFAGAVGAQALMLAGAGRDATAAATAVRCEHQTPTKPQRAEGTSRAPRATSRTNARRARGKGSRRR